MFRILRLYLVLTVSLLVFGVACKKNRPPVVPQLSGPSIGKPGGTLTFTITTTDPENQEVAYKISWGDTSTVEWTSTYSSGQQVTRTHAYADSGVYHVKVKARDTQESESEWTDSAAISIGFKAPNQPMRPLGPSSCTTGIADTFGVTTTHPLGDSVWFQFDWGEAIGGWNGPIASGTIMGVLHTFDSVATFNVMARAKDARGAVSPWSEPLVVTVTAHQGAGGPPTGIYLSAITDSTVRIAWTAPGQGTPDRYVVSFKQTGSPSYTDIGQTNGTSYDHDPSGKTGTYQVRAVFGSDEHVGTDVPSTTPVHTATIRVYELNGTGNAGYGWDRSTGAGGLYSMSQAGNAAYVDFYITDFAPGSASMLAIASPDLGPTDPGNVVPNGNWRINSFTNPLPNEMGPLPSFYYISYFNYTDIASAPLNIGAHTADGNFALTKITGLSSGYVDLETWFQLVPNLRLIQH